MKTTPKQQAHRKYFVQLHFKAQPMENAKKILNPELMNNPNYFESENLELEVGKMYYVKCAKYLTSDDKIDYIPINGEPHRDPQFGETGKLLHYHVDGRFSNYRTNGQGKTNTVLVVDPDKFWLTHWNDFLGIEIKLKRCKRLTTGLIISFDGLSILSEYRKFYTQYVGKSCKGKRCPHLGATMIDKGDRLVCPLHNLQGCKTNEKIIEPTTHY